jgi:hypothetical protein
MQKIFFAFKKNNKWPEKFRAIFILAAGMTKVLRPGVAFRKSGSGLL